MKKLSIMFASVAMLFGVGLGVSALNENSINVEKADAASFGAGTNIYLAGTGDITITGSVLSAWVHYSTGGSHWECFENDPLSGYYMITLDSAATGLTFARTQNKSDGGTNWGDVGEVYNQTDMNFESGKNWIWPKSWANSITCEWRFISYHVAGTFSDPTWQGTSDTYKMNDGFDDSSNHQASFTLTTTKENEEFKCTGNYNGDVPGDNWYGTLESGYNTKYIGTSGGNILLKVAGTYEIYLKSNRKVWVQISSATEANEYALEFLDAITCTNTSTTFDISAWNNVSGTGSMEYKFGQLTVGAQNVLKGALPNPSGSNVEKCVARYDRILSKYGYGEAEGQYHDFMGRTPATLSSALRIGLPDAATTTTTLTVIIVTVIALGAVGGFFLIKRKKKLD